jgi:peptide/nickel transport system substrate-binding protein
MGILRFNQLYPPFDNPAMRRALLSAIDQDEAMITLAGDDPADRYSGIGVFPTGTPLANDAGIEVLKGPRDYAAAKTALAEAEYKGEPIVVISPTDIGGISQLSRIGSEQMRRAGLNVDFQEMDFGTVIRRRTNQGPPDKGGWNVFFTLIDRSIPSTNPFGHQALRSDGKAAWDGWPTSTKIEALRARWLDTAEMDQQQRIARELQMQVWQDLPFIPMGEYWQTTAYRKDLTGIVSGCFTVFWGVRRA